MMRKRNKFLWRAPHHLYVGIISAVFWAVLWYTSIPYDLYSFLLPFYQLFFLISIYIAVDDVIEHSITKDTPLRSLFNKIIVPILRRKK